MQSTFVQTTKNVGTQHFFYVATSRFFRFIFLFHVVINLCSDVVKALTKSHLVKEAENITIWLKIAVLVETNMS